MGKVFRLTLELSLLLPCFGLSALYLRIGDPARRLASLNPGTVRQWKVSFHIFYFNFLFYTRLTKTR